MAIQNRRGNFVDFDPYKMLAGEFAYALDTEELYYCVSPGNVKRCATKEEVIEILETSQEAYDGLQQLLTELGDETVATGILNDISTLFAEVADLDTRVSAHLAENVSDVVLVARDLSIEGVQNVAMTIKPKVVIAIGVVQDQDNSITIGILSSTTQYGASGRAGGVGKYGLINRLLRVYGATDSDHVTGVAAITDTGLSIEWSKIGNGATGTIQVTILGITHGGA